MFGFAISFGLALLAVRRRRTWAPINAATEILYTIPSLAVFAALVPITGLTLATAEVPLVMYTLVIYVRNLVAGFDSVPADVLEAAAGMGFSPSQRLWRVELPLAVPLIVAGLRIAAVSTIGIVTISGILGDRFGGLGFFIFEGYHRAFPTEIYAGAVASILLAIIRRPSARARATADHPVDLAQGGRGARAMTIVSETIAWLTDPAHYVGPDGIPIRLLQHVFLSGVAFLVAAMIALPVGLAVGHSGRGAGLAVNLANVGRAIPTLAVIGIMVPITQALDPRLGFTFYPTLIGLVVLALPPILVNTYAGIGGVDRDLVEAARGMGMREGQILRGVEIPLALPVILAGLRLASVTIVATATLGAIFGYGGLGRYLVDGIAQNNDGKLFAGVVLAAGITLITEARVRPDPANGAVARASARPDPESAPARTNT